MKRKETARVISQERISGDICSLVLSVTFAGDVSAGQFVSLFPRGKEKLLPRPISVCAADAAAGTIWLVYRVAGKGTKEFSQLIRGDEVEVMGPLGHGFPLEEARGKRVLLIGGGIGIPPLLFCAKALATGQTVHICWKSLRRFAMSLSRRMTDRWVCTARCWMR